MASGVTCSPELKQKFQQSKLGNTRYIQIVIENGQWVEKSSGNKVSANWEKDLDLIPKILEEKSPSCVIYFKNGGQSLLLSYMPENATPKDKMTFSSSKNALKALMGDKFEDYFGTTKNEFSYESYTKAKSVKGPMSYVEEQLEALPKQLDAADVHKSQGFGLLAIINNKAMPKVVANSGGGGAFKVSSPRSPTQSQAHDQSQDQDHKGEQEREVYIDPNAPVKWDRGRVMKWLLEEGYEDVLVADKWKWIQGATLVSLSLHDLEKMISDPSRIPNLFQQIQSLKKQSEPIVRHV